MAAQVRIAVSQDSGALQFASEELRRDSDSEDLFEILFNFFELLRAFTKRNLPTAARVLRRAGLPCRSPMESMVIPQLLAVSLGI